MKKPLLVLTIFLAILTFIMFFPFGEKDHSSQVEIFLISNDIHVGIVVPKKNEIKDWGSHLIQDYFDPSVQHFDWIEFGWGDKRFYFEMPTWDQFTLELALDALFVPDEAVMHVGLLFKPSPSRWVRKISISYESYKKIVHAIERSFVLNKGKPILIPNRGYGLEDNFFEAHGSYSLLRTCNSWTAEVFAAAGLRHPLWAPTKYGLELMWNGNL